MFPIFPPASAVEGIKLVPSVCVCLCVRLSALSQPNRSWHFDILRWLFSKNTDKEGRSQEGRQCSGIFIRNESVATCRWHNSRQRLYRNVMMVTGVTFTVATKCRWEGCTGNLWSCSIQMFRDSIAARWQNKLDSSLQCTHGDFLNTHHFCRNSCLPSKKMW